MRQAAMRFNPTLSALQAYHSGPPLSSLMEKYGLTRIAQLSSNECPEGPFPEVAEALERALPDLNRYPSGGCDRLRTAVAERLDVGPSRLVFGNGSCEILMFLGEALVTPGDHVVFAEPSFVMYDMIMTLRGARCSRVPLHDHAHDLGSMAQAITPETRLAIVCNPNNPTGTTVEPGPLRSFLEAVPPSTAVILDEAYVEYVASPNHADSLPLLDEFENLIILRTFSKIYGLAGMRVGYGVAHPDLVEAMDKVRQPFNVTTLAQVAATEAIAHPGRVRARREHVSAERARLCAGFADLGLAYVPSEANFILFQADTLAVPGPEVAQALLERGVVTRSGYAMGCPGWVRVTVGSVPENDLFLEKLAELAVLGPAGRG
jgi:histidinol-phosphate aminotransferase